MNKKIAKLFFAAAAAFTLGVASCGGGSSEVGPKIDSIELDKYELSMLKGETATLEVTVTPSDAKFQLVWTTSNSNVVTVDESGLISAVGEGSADVTVSVKNTSAKEKCSVTVAPDWHDYVKDGSVQLNLDYKNRSFYKDGIEKVTLQTAIDGDTAHFKTSTTTLKARFYGIDTPESTGKVQPWGVEASDFTKQKLKAANEKGTIVVSSPSSEYGAPDPDSTGSRYVSLIWINEEKKDAPLSELYLLNLWVVQEGFSLVRQVSNIPEYEQSFRDAYDQAVVYKKNMWSGKPAPGYNYDEGYRDVSLLDIKREVELSILDSEHVNAFDNQKVRFTGVVSSYSDGTLYVQEFYPTLDEDGNEQYDKDHNIIGEWAGINIFCGMQVISTKFTKPNTYLHVYGLCKDSPTFGFQITDTQGKWKTYGAGEEDCKVLLKAEENTEEHSLYTFHYTVSELNKVAKENNCESLFCAVSVSGTITCYKAFISDDRAITLYFTDVEWNVYIPYAYHGDQTSEQTAVDRWDAKEDFEGRTFTLESGTYAWHRTTSGKVVYQIIPTSELTFLWVH